MKTHLSSEVTATFIDWTQMDVGGPGGVVGYTPQHYLHRSFSHFLTHEEMFNFFLKNTPQRGVGGFINMQSFKKYYHLPV